MGGGDKISCRLHFLYRFHPTTTAGEPHAHILSQPLHLLARDMHLDTAQGIASDVVRIIVNVMPSSVTSKFSVVEMYSGKKIPAPPDLRPP